MAKVLRIIVSVERGLDPRDFVLMAFGGGGPLHACALAGDLGMRRVVIPRYPGLFSALPGIARSRRIASDVFAAFARCASLIRRRLRRCAVLRRKRCRPKRGTRRRCSCEALLTRGRPDDRFGTRSTGMRGSRSISPCRSMAMSAIAGSRFLLTARASGYAVRRTSNSANGSSGRYALHPLSLSALVEGHC